MLVAPGSGAVRIARGLACALSGLLLGSAAHLLAEGHPPSLVATVLSFAVLSLVGVALAETQRGFAFIATVLAGSQLFLHYAFAISSAPSIVVNKAGQGAAIPPAGTDHATMTADAMSPAASAAGDAATSWAGAMTLGHVLATLVAAACLAYGERAIWRLARLVLPLLWVFLRPIPVLQAAPRPRSRPPVFKPAHSVLLVRCRPRRGPPGLAIA